MNTMILATTLTIALTAAAALGADCSYVIVGTGQTKCYDNHREITPPKPGQPFYGQDAQFQHTRPSYRINRDGIVSDLNTGLMWIQNPATNRCGWTEATRIPAALNGKNFAGHNDWRLPSVKELYSIIDYGRGWPRIDTNYFGCPLDARIAATQYWTSNRALSGGSHAEAYGVNFTTGHIKVFPLQVGHFVRCVRGNTRYGQNDFCDNRDGTITDRATGLTWSQQDSKLGMNWEAALAWVQAKNRENFLGRNDWRLPNAKEMQSIVDYTPPQGIAESTKAIAVIHPLFSCSSITNENGQGDYPYYWTSTSCYRGPEMPQYSLAWYVAFGLTRHLAVVQPKGKGKGPGHTLSRRIAEAGAVRFNAKAKGGPAGDGLDRINNYVRLVRGGLQ